MKRLKIMGACIVLMMCSTACEKSVEKISGGTTEIEIMTESTNEDTQEVNATTEESSQEEQEENITFKMVEIPKEKLSEDGVVLVSGSISYPVFTIEDNEDLAKKLNDDIENELKEYDVSFEDYGTQAAAAYAQASDYEFYQYGYYMQIGVNRIDDKIVSLTESILDYTGGAHGSEFIYGINYDMATGSRLILDDISVDSAAFKGDILEQIKEQAKTEYYTNLLDPDVEGLFEEMLLADGKWYFDKDGIHFFANQYELACYAAGIIEFVIPYENLVGLKENYSYDGNFQRKVNMGNATKYDLDGDGSEEEVYYQVTYDENYSPVSSFTVDGQDYSAEVAMEFPCIDAYYLIDLDRTDDFVEIALMDYGPSDDPLTYFYRLKKDGTLKFIGEVTDLWSSSSCYLKSDNHIVANNRLDLLQTWFASASWTVNDDETISLVEGEIYYPQTTYSTNVNLIQNIMVYSAMDENSEKIEVTPEDGPIRFTATDNVHWIEFETNDGRILYLYMKDFSTIVSDGTEIDTLSVFEGLILAD